VDLVALNEAKAGRIARAMAKEQERINKAREKFAI
jgi:hypothetical protein